MNASAIESRELACGCLVSVDDRRIVLAIPNTDYQLHLVPTVPASQITTPPGKRIYGVIEAKALRMHNAHGGGLYIEPVYGVPRIVQGRALAVDKERNRLLMNLAVPVWVTMHEGQRAEDIALNQLANFYVETGATFTPLPDDT